jgi:preprotein translocase subunit SecF
MSLSAIAALVHDIAVTVGVYAVFGFPVTPATVIAFLTILGYSLYDTVVVFDKVDENTRGLASSGRMTYSDTVNLSMNQVLMRSLNTSLVAILPILSVLVIGSVLLGATTLQEFGLALFIGLLTGAYSSIFIASPMLAMLKEREPRYATIRQRIESRGAAGALLTPAAAAAAGIGRPPTGRGARAAQPDDDFGDEPIGAGAGGARGGSDGGADAGEEGPTDGDGARPGQTTARGARNGAGGTPRTPPRPGGGRPGGRPAPRGRKKGKRR